MCSSTHNGFHILPVMDLAGATFVRPGASFATGGYHFGDGFFRCFHPHSGSSNGLKMKQCESYVTQCDMIPLSMWVHFATTPLLVGTCMHLNLHWPLAGEGCSSASQS